MRRMSFVVLGAYALCGVGCSDDEDGGEGGSTTSGIPSSTRLSELTPDQATQLCEANVSTFSSIAQSACTLNAVAGSTDATQCEMMRTQCEMTVGADAGMSGGVDCSQVNTGDLTGCDVTVGEVDGCFQQLTSYFNGLSCENAGSLPPTPTCFASLQTSCPLFGGMPAMPVPDGGV